MKKKLVIMLCCVMVAALFSGCQNTSSKNTENTAASSTNGTTENNSSSEANAISDDSTAPTDLAAQAIADRKAKADETGEYETVELSFFTWVGEPAGLARINESLKAYTEEKLGLDVVISIQDVSSYQQNAQLMLSSGEQMDIFTTCTLSYTNCVSSGYCLDLEEDNLLQNYAKDILEAIDTEYLDACRIGGKLYGVPGLKDYAISTTAICVGSEYLDAVGYDYVAADPEEKGYIKTDWDTIDSLFASMHEAFPNLYVYSPQDNLLNQGSSVDPVGGDFFGALVDTVNSLQVTDPYESDVFYDWCNRMYTWNQAGYISADALTDTNGASARIKSGSCMAMMACGKPGYKTQISGECGRDMTVFYVGEDILKSSAVSSFPWCINQNVEDKVAVVQVLNAFYEDEYISNLLVWGEEGKDYVQTDDGHITFPEGVDANNAEYYTTMLWLMPNYFISHVWEKDPLDVYDQTRIFNASAPKSKALGFAWDNGDYSSEFTAMTNVYNEYGPALTFGFTDPASGIPELVEQLKNAGLETYMAAKQEALNEWAEINGVN